MGPPVNKRRLAEVMRSTQMFSGHSRPRSTLDRLQLAIALARRPATWAQAAALVLLVASIGSYRLIPGWGAPWGLDLDNLWVFHHCVHRDAPYGVPGSACGDPVGRPIPYPPLLYWSFAWTRGVSFPAARWIWAATSLAILLGTAVLWARMRDPEKPPPSRSATASAIVLGVLLAAEFPAVFAIERGNNDVLVLLVWTAASALFLRGRRAAAGGLAGLAAALKVYPAVAACVLAAGALGLLLRGDRAERRAAMRTIGALAIVPAAVALSFSGQTRAYVTAVLPRFAAHVPAVTVHSHSVPATLPAPWLWSGALITAWCAASFARLRDAPREVLAGALAVSTYVAATSFDYDLVTAYPLLVVQLLRALEAEGTRAVRAWAVLGLGLVAIVGHRALFLGFPAAHVVLQVAWLAASATLVALDPPRGRRAFS